MIISGNDQWEKLYSKMAEDINQTMQIYPFDIIKSIGNDNDFINIIKTNDIDK